MPTDDRHETVTERLDRNWNELLQELRVTQTGVQLLTAFLLSLPLQQRFAELDHFELALYLLAVALSVGATALLVAPVAVHRALFRHHEKDRLVNVGDWCARAGLCLLAASVSDVVAFIVSVVVGRAAAVTAGLVVLVGFAVLWWLVPTRVRTHAEDRRLDTREVQR
jgi:hypothetical protein